MSGHTQRHVSLWCVIRIRRLERGELIRPRVPVPSTNNGNLTWETVGFDTPGSSSVLGFKERGRTLGSRYKTDLSIQKLEDRESRLVF